MADVHDRETRSRNMAAIKGRDTKPEVWLRKELFKRGFRYRIHRKDLPGRPDIVLPRFKTVIFVNGCFWHSHTGCVYFTRPSSNHDFWAQKLSGNKNRDRKNYAALLEAGWKVIIVWECAIKGSKKQEPDALINRITTQLIANSKGIIEIGETG